MRIRNFVLAAFAAAGLLLHTTLLQAASLQVSPVSIEVAAPGATATLKLRNEATTPLSAQIRVFRWSQVNGEEKLEPTDDVVASPPLATLTSKTDYIVRVVRLAKKPVAAGESYRLLVDELPDPSVRRDRTINIVVRYSIPVFFYTPGAAPAKVTWSVDQRGGRLHVSATNAGDRHVRISRLNLSDKSGKILSFGNGLTGYALGHSTMRWAAPAGAIQLSAAGITAIAADGDQGPIRARPTTR